MDVGIFEYDISREDIAIQIASIGMSNQSRDMGIMKTHS